MARSTTSRRTPDTATGDARAATRQRIIDAAKEEFAQHGIAGARVDRIAKQAQTSKERVYAYFSSKEALYHHVAEQELTALVEATQLDTADLPGYAGILFDHFTARPDHYRLITWGRLELADDADATDPLQTTIARKIDQLGDAQRSGLLDTSWDPVDVLALINQIATTWAGQPEICAAAAQRAADTSTAARRAALVTAVERLFPRTS
ncbi:TetR family transcriptional regulator [Streptomyces erythrochromogenes]|uniref:TetR family transcriptional regulator n=1 Tax=Streptomyces erythrochromogenes TaxID=285574 RepID=UPI003699D856